MRALALSLLAAVGLTSSVAQAKKPPALEGRVNDYANLLSSSDRHRLEQTLASYEQRTGHQFALLTVDSLQGDAIEEFSIRVAEAWKLGSKGRDDGLILVIAKKERRMRIEVGYGLEGAVPDAIAKRVIDERITPEFKRGDFAAGIGAGFDALMRAAAGESLGPAPVSRTPTGRSRPRGGGFLSLLVLLILMTGGFLPILLAAVFGLVGYAMFGWVGGVIGAIAGFAFGWTIRGGGGRGGGSNFIFIGGSGGGWSSGGGGGFSSGGFSGGGGGFGGGGASGSW